MEPLPFSGLKLTGQDDKIFAGRHYPKPFAFTQEVAQVFDDMVRRSIPLYCDVTRFTADLAVHFYQPGSWLIDIGCSTGTTTHLIGHQLQVAAQFLALDKAEAMIEKAEAKLLDFPERHRLELACEDIMSRTLPPASVVIINYTLQFLPIADRRLLLQRIFDSLLPNGILMISEKVRAASSALQEVKTLLYERFKEEQGYSRTEIERKKEALDQVLIPFTEEEHRAHLKAVGFGTIDSLMKWNNFVTLLAIKES